MDHSDLVQLLADGKDGVQRSHGFLEDHSNLLTTDPVDLVDGHLGDVIDLLFQHILTVLVGNGITLCVTLVVLGLEADAAAVDLTGRTLDQTHNGHRGNGLAAAGFAHDTHNGVTGHIVGNTVNSLDHTLLGIKESVQIFDLQNVIGILHLGEEFCFLCLTVLVSFQFLDPLGVGLGNGLNFLTGEIILILLFSCHNYLLAFGSSASRRPSPTKLKPRTAITMQIPAGTQTLG